MRTLSAIAALAAMTAIWSGQAQASAVGFSYGTGTESWDYSEPVSTYSEDRNTQSLYFVFDTAVSSSRVFNYRFSIGLEESNHGKMIYKGRSMTHDFGFRVVDIPVMRLWVGPELKVTGFETFENEASGQSWGGFMLGVGIGPVIGMNFHLPEVLSFGLTLGYRHTSWGGHYGGVDQGADSQGVHVQASMLFRFNENF